MHSTSCSRPLASASLRPSTLRCSPAASRLSLRSSPVRQPRRKGVALVQAAAANAQTAAFPRWDFMYRQLVGKGLESLQPADAAAMVADGRAVLVDVRMAAAHEKAHPQGSVSAPVFQQIDLADGFNFGKAMKLAAMAANGVQPTEYNPKFIEQVKAAAAGGKAVILACEAGGTLAATTNFATGKVSRSLKACWKAIDSGVAPQVYHLEGGVFGWYKAGLPMVGEYTAENVGRTPAAADSK